MKGNVTKKSPLVGERVCFSNGRRGTELVVVLLLLKMMCTFFFSPRRPFSQSSGKNKLRRMKTIRGPLSSSSKIRLVGARGDGFEEGGE